MKQNKTIPVLIVIMLFIAGGGAAQTVDYAKQVSDKIANKLKDSLGLSGALRTKVYDINAQLSDSKMQIWKTYTDSIQLQVNLQRIENTRDSLYKAILPSDKFQLYLKKKATVVSND